MKYLLGFLEGLPDGPNLSDPEFQQLLVDVQAGKTQPKSADAFYESLEKVVNELKSTPESLPFQKPVTRRDAPDYYEVIKKPMDLSTMLRNIKQHKYKAKADFAADLNLIWDNCALYNHEGHPIRVQARFMKQKADHHLEFLADRNDPPAQNFILPHLTGADVASRRIAATGSHAPSQPSPLREASQVPGQDEDAQGESLGSEGGADGGGDQSFRDEAGAGPQSKTAAQEDQEGQQTASGSSHRETGSVPAESRQNNRVQTGGVGRGSTANWPKLQTSLDSSSALVRTSSTMSNFFPLSLAHLAGPSFSDKGKAKEIIASSTVPGWYTPTSAEQDGAEDGGLGKWWGSLTKDEAYTGGLPSTPTMAPPVPRRILRIRKKTRRKSPRANGVTLGLDGHSPPSQTPSLLPSRPVNLERLVHRNVDKLFEARRLMGKIQDWQRIEGEGGILPPIQKFDRKLEREQRRAERVQRREQEQEVRVEARARAQIGGEMGEAEAVAGIRKATAGMLAHAGFEGANEIALNTMTRLLTDHVRNLGRTFRLFLDGSSHDMSPEQITLHALHQNGQIQLQDLEAHIKDDIEREGTKIAELTRKVRQGYKDVTAAPVVQDDMLFAADGEMLMDGNFADELGEDFLGLREMGIDKEFGLSSLTVPSSLFHGRRKRAVNADQYGAKQPEYDYPPPPGFIPLNHSSMLSQLPALLHSFYNSRLESGQSISEDDKFDHVHAQIGSMGQIIEKKVGNKKKLTEGEKRERPDELKKIKPKKPPKIGVGKGNWIRPPKEERDRRAAEKKAALERSRQATANGSVEMDGAAGEDDAEGEEE